MKTERQLNMVDPSNIYQKTDECISASLHFLCFKATDNLNGLDVYWYEINTSQISEQQKNYIAERTAQISKIKVSGLLGVLKFWFNQEKTIFYIITESANSKPILNQMIGANINLKIITKWAKSILETLNHLHSQNPPIIHNNIDVSCVFIKPPGNIKLLPPVMSSNDVKINNYNIKLTYATPPEALENNLEPVSDIWSFAIAMIYVYTGKQPYSECQGPLQLIDRIMQFKPPDDLNTIDKSIFRDFLAKCFLPAKHRPSAADLLKDEFFNVEDDNTSEASVSNNLEIIFIKKQDKGNVASTGVSDPHGGMPIALADTRGTINLSTPYIRRHDA